MVILHIRSIEMHSQQGLLVRARSKPEAIEKAELFLERYRDGVWDWFQFGGRRAWSEMYQVAMDDLTLPTKTGRAWKDAKSVERGFEIRREIDDSPLSEVVSAEEPCFLDRLREALERHEAEFQMAAEAEAEETDPDSLEYWTYVRKSLAAGDVYDNFVHFFDTVRGRSDFPPELEKELQTRPHGWYLVNVDIHW